MGWVQPNVPGNALPSVTLTSPAAGVDVVPGATVSLTASASDSNGSVARVQYYVNGALAAQATTPPYAASINPVPVGTYSVVAVAIDNQGGMAKSPPVTFTVSAPLTTVVLQRGLNGYAGSADTFLDGTLPTTSRGAYDTLFLDPIRYTPLVRFAIFQSEGGPVPDGAVLQSATLSLYKQFYSDPLQINAVLKPWNEAETTWLNARTGVPWTAQGAASAGADYVATPDFVVAPSFNPGWVAFDVTSRVQAWSAGGSNNGWRVSQTNNGGNSKTFTASEFAADPTARPKLTVVYSGGGGGGNVAPTVSLTSPATGASVTLGGAFALAANAADADGSIAKVEFFANGVSLGQDTTSPYSGSWTPSGVGTYTVTAVATDNLGKTTTSAPASVTVNPATGGTTVVLQRGLAGYQGWRIPSSTPPCRRPRGAATTRCSSIVRITCRCCASRCTSPKAARCQTARRSSRRRSRCTRVTTTSRCS